VKILSSYEVWGKTSGISLLKHTEDCKKVLKYIIDNHKIVLRNWCNRNNRNFDDFLRNLELAIHYHDFGKATEEWQKVARLIANGEKKGLPPHAPYSGYFLIQDDIYTNIQNENVSSYIPLLVCVSHHSLLTDYSWKNLSKLGDFHKEYLQKYNEETNHNKLNFDRSWQNYIGGLRRFQRDSQNQKFRGLSKDKRINTRFKAEYCLMLSLITATDGIASDLEEKNTDKVCFREKIENTFPHPKSISKKLETLGDYTELTDIQKEILKISASSIEDYTKPLIIEAPCGEGKTWASLLWARKLFDKELINRVIFTLPTQITSNNMVKEFETEYKIPKKWIGIYHSEVMSLLIEEGDEEDSVDIIKYWNSIYSKPFTISTVDHLLLSLVNGYKFAPRSFGNMQNSLVVIDELHYYDVHTIGMIKCLCKILRELKIPHIIMSATIPEILSQEFNSYLRIKSNGKDKKGRVKQPYKFVYHKTPILEDDTDGDEGETRLSRKFMELIHKFKARNIGVILNTVRKSKQLFDKLDKKLPDHQILLYNSQFMRKDRITKEKLIRILGKNIYKKIDDSEIKFCKDYGFDPKKPFIFIGTQVAEISLNISFDIILSDLAPLDALFQRGGRLHRKQTFFDNKKCNCGQCKRFDNEHIYELHVFDTGEFCYPYYCKKEDHTMKQIIDNSRKIVSSQPIFKFEDSLIQISKVYCNKNMFDEFNSRVSFRNTYIEDLIFGGRPSKNEEGNLRIITREIDSMQFDVLPRTFEYHGEQIDVDTFLRHLYTTNVFCRNNKLTKNGVNELTRHMLKISNKHYYSNKGQDHLLGKKWLLRTIDLDYDFRKGLYSKSTIF